MRAPAGHDQTHEGTWSSASRWTHIVHFSTVPSGRAPTIPVSWAVGRAGVPQLKFRTPYGQAIMQ
jgi:hypothetical protein